MSEVNNFPPQTLPFRRKTKKWRKQCMDWADSKTFVNYDLVRTSVIKKKINYDLINGKLHMSDMQMVLNPQNVKAAYIPDRVQHYPIINSKLNVLRGEESKRVFDFRVVVTNPNAISEKENNKKEELFEKLQELISDSSQTEEEFNEELEKLNKYYTYEWQDLKEIRANSLLEHYTKEYNIPLIFNTGFMDALTVGEEIYQCDIIGGEPIIKRLNPLKVRIFKSGYSNRIEDADMVILEDYWSPGKIIDAFYDELSKKDIEYLESIPNTLGSSRVDDMGNIDERHTLIGEEFFSEITGDTTFWNPPGTSSGIHSNLIPYDFAGNIRVLRLYWKSRRRIKKVKSYDPTTGEEEFNFYPEDYEIDELMGEEEEIMYINEAWEGIKIGEKIYVRMRPRPIQYNRLSNPSRCHFGIIGSIYNINENKPFSLVDMMKPYNYLYNIIHARLNDAIAANWGSLVRLDLSKVPKDWTVDKWMYFAKVNKILVEDSFNEGTIGASTGKLAGALNNASSGGLSLDTGNHIQHLQNLLEFIKMEMSEVGGISKQREGQISNRETVGGVERATLQSSHITEWLFFNHDDVKKRTLECFLETAKIALRGRKKKFQYILSDKSTKIVEIDGDEFSEADYGLVVDNGEGIQDLKAKLDTLAQAALQNSSLSFSTIMKLYNSSSLAEKQRMIEQNEEELREMQSQQQQAEIEARDREIEANREVELAKLKVEEDKNIRDNETKLQIEKMKYLYNTEEVDQSMGEGERAKLVENARQYDSNLKLAKDKFKLDERKFREEIALKKKQVSLQSRIKNNNNKPIKK